MRLKYDPLANAAYLYIVDPIEPGAAVTQEVSADSGLILDFDVEGRLLGIELLSPHTQLRPETLDLAEPY